MLVLTRKSGQGIVVGDATITVLKINGNRVTLGIKAPGATRILRCEVGGPEGKKETTNN